MRHNPYTGINWGTVKQIKSFTHMHVYTQQLFEQAYELGYRHFPISHYQPSSPKYPLDNFFTNVPVDILGCPNSEKVKATNDLGSHYCAIGSTQAGHGHDDVITLTWQDLYMDIFNNLQYPTGGGLQINHPTGVKTSTICTRLDYDNRVLGHEIYNDGETDATNLEYLKLWNSVLKTGRRCFGFCVIDWMLEGKKFDGSSVLLVSDFTEQKCLEAYRNGAFYGILQDTGLRFTSLASTDTIVTVGVNRSATISFITDKGIEKTVTGTSATFSPIGRVYCRVEVQEGSDMRKRMFSQPFMYKNRKDVNLKKAITNVLLLG